MSHYKTNNSIISHYNKNGQYCLRFLTEAAKWQQFVTNVFFQKAWQ